MPRTKSKILTDVDESTWVDQFQMGPSDLRMAEEPAWSITKSTLRGGLTDGVDIIEVNNGALSFSVLPTRGMGIWRGQYKEIPIGWRSPVVGPVNPMFVNELERGGLGWLRGFDEAIVRCGLESNGAPCRDTVLNNMGQPAEVDLTLHGKIANTPASYVEVEAVAGKTAELKAIGRTCEAGLFIPQLRMVTTISTQVGSNSLTIVDEVTNIRGVEAEMELLYHCNFGPPFLDKGARLEIAARMVAPRDERAAEGVDTYDLYQGPTPGYTEQCYWYETIGGPDGSTLAMLRNKAADKAVVLRFNRNDLPCFTQWKNTASEEDGYVTGLEPGTNFPNAKPFERKKGRVVKLAPGEARRTTLVLEVLDSAKAISEAQQEIGALQKGTGRTVYRAPQASYSDV